MAVRVPFVPTPIPVARKMLELAGAGPGDTLYDLGCGDGRIAILAAKDFGVDRAVCVELREDLAERALEEAKRQGVADRVEVRREDMFRADISDATIVTLFLLTSVNNELAPKLRRELKPGTRIVSHEFQITGWKPLAFATVSEGHISHNIYLYVVGYSTR